jgi:hypothetical protein
MIVLSFFCFSAFGAKQVVRSMSTDRILLFDTVIALASGWNMLGVSG